MTIQNLILKVVPAAIILVSIGALGSDDAQNKFVCGQAGDLRLISVEYLDPPKAVPCRVCLLYTSDAADE